MCMYVYVDMYMAVYVYVYVLVHVHVYVYVYFLVCMCAESVEDCCRVGLGSHNKKSYVMVFNWYLLWGE